MIIHSSDLLLTHVTWGEESSTATEQFQGQSDSVISCPTDLSYLQPDMREALKFVTSSHFRETMLTSLQASIPDAIAHADGLASQIAFLKQEIIRQEAERRHAEDVAREVINDPSGPLKPCRRGKEENYCYAIEQYYVSEAANLANQAFLEALQCYQRHGVR